MQTKLVIADFSDKTLDIYEHIRESIANLDIGILVNNVGVIQSQPAYFNEVDEMTLINTVQVRLNYDVSYHAYNCYRPYQLQ